MSSISSLGGNVQGIFQFIQSLSGTSQTPSTSATTSTSTATDPTQSATQAVSGGHHHHHGHSGSGVFKQIQDAVTNALQTAQSSGGSSSDPNQIVESAIAQVLKSNSAATTATGSTNAATTAQTSSTDSNADAATEATGGTSSLASFFQALQTAGVNPQQFQQDFLNAVKDAQGGQVNASTAFQSIPIGSTIDTLG